MKKQIEMLKNKEKYIIIIIYLCRYFKIIVIYYSFFAHYVFICIPFFIMFLCFVMPLLCPIEIVRIIIFFFPGKRGGFLRALTCSKSF